MSNEVKEIRKRTVELEQMAERLRGHKGIQAAWISAENLEGIATDLRTLLDLKPEWVSVEERLPEESVIEEYLVVLKESFGEFSNTAVWSSPHWYSDKDMACILGGVTHWMPLPAAPQEEEDDA